MKQILMVCLIGMGLLCPIAKANSSVVNHFVHRIVDVTVDGLVLFATSSSPDGAITQIKIWEKETAKLKITQSCSGNSCTVDVSDLLSGTYVAKVFTTNSSYIEEFTMP